MNNPHVTVQSGSAARQQGGARYMAPEQLEHSVTGKESDIHSFAITGYEVRSFRIRANTSSLYHPPIFRSSSRSSRTLESPEK